MHLNSPGNSPSQGHTSRSNAHSTFEEQKAECPRPPPTYPFFQASALRGRQIRHEGFLLKANLLKCIPSLRKQYASKKHLSAAPGAGFGPGQCVFASSDSRFPGGPQHKSFTADPHNTKFCQPGYPHSLCRSRCSHSPVERSPAGVELGREFEYSTKISSQYILRRNAAPGRFSDHKVRTVGRPYRLTLSCLRLRRNSLLANSTLIESVLYVTHDWKSIDS